MDNPNFCSACGSSVKPIHDHWVCVNCNKSFYKNPIVGVAGIYIQNNKILLGKRKGSYKNMWCIPCGYVDYDESIQSALKREMKEETNLIVKDYSLYEARSNFHNPLQHTVGVYYLIHEVAGTLKAKDDLKDVRFFDYQSIYDLAFPSDVFILKKLNRDKFL